MHQLNDNLLTLLVQFAIIINRANNSTKIGYYVRQSWFFYALGILYAPGVCECNTLRGNKHAVYLWLLLAPGAPIKILAPIYNNKQGGHCHG